MFGKLYSGAKTLLIAIVMTISTVSLYAQTPQSVSLTKQRLSLSELLHEIEHHTGMFVVISADRIDLNREITLSDKSGTVEELLTQALTGTGHSWRQEGHYIVIAPQPKLQPQRQVVAVVPQPTSEEFERDVNRYTQSNIDTDDADVDFVIRYDTIRREVPHDGIFRYRSRELNIESTSRAVHTTFSRSTPPLLAVKTNLVWWAARATLNIAGEIGLGKHTSIEVSGGNNRWNLNGTWEDNKKLTHWVIKPEFRYWFCERFNGHFLGVHAMYGQYNIGGYTLPPLFESGFRYEGEAYGGGINYGYHLPLAKRWGLEFTAGLGILWMDYLKTDCEKCGIEDGRYKRTYFGPTQLGVKVVFMIK